MDEKAFLAAIVDSSDDAIIGKTLDGIVLSWNRGAERLYGYSPDEMVGSPIAHLVPEGYKNDVPMILGKIRKNQQVANYETKRRRKDGKILDVSLTVSPIRTPDGEVVAAATIARDVTRQKELEQELTTLVYHDDLTGLANRRRFTEEIHQRVAHAKRYGWRGAVILLDLDNFKSLNDTLGHNAGDALLQRAALKMWQVLRSSDLLARLGGDEFGILLPEADREDAEIVANKLTEAMAAQEVLIQNKRVGTASIGICLLHEPVAPDEPLSRADVAMYKVKERGGNGYEFYVRSAESELTAVAPRALHALPPPVSTPAS